MNDLIRLAKECGATVYTNRHTPLSPAIAFGDEAWARFEKILSKQGTKCSECGSNSNKQIAALLKEDNVSLRREITTQNR